MGTPPEWGMYKPNFSRQNGRSVECQRSCIDSKKWSFICHISNQDQNQRKRMEQTTVGVMLTLLTSLSTPRYRYTTQSPRSSKGAGDSRACVRLGRDRSHRGLGGGSRVETLSRQPNFQTAVIQIIRFGALTLEVKGAEPAFRRSVPLDRKVRFHMYRHRSVR